MFYIRNVPIVIEPGIGAFEAEFIIEDPTAGKRMVAVHLCRVSLDGKSVKDLPFIPTTRLPHVFSLTSNIKKSSALVLYDALGRIAKLYTRDKNSKVWEQFDIADEHSGKSVTQFSIRFSFNTSKDRTTFLTLMEKMAQQAGKEEQPAMDDVMTALRTLARTRVAPSVLPIAVEKCKLSPIKL
jgi:hypothetical protein